MFVRAAVIWLAILVLASLNGAVRDLIVAPRVGDTAARAISTLVLCALVLLVTWTSIRWRPSARTPLGSGADRHLRCSTLARQGQRALDHSVLG